MPIEAQGESWSGQGTVLYCPSAEFTLAELRRGLTIYPMDDPTLNPGIGIDGVHSILAPSRLPVIPFFSVELAVVRIVTGGIATAFGDAFQPLGPGDKKCTVRPLRQFRPPPDQDPPLLNVTVDERGTLPKEIRSAALPINIACTGIETLPREVTSTSYQQIFPFTFSSNSPVTG